MAEINELKEKGNSALAAGNFDEAIKCYSDAINFDKSNHVLFSNRSAAYAKAGKFEEALRDAERTIEIQPNWAKGYSRKGAALTGLQKYQEAQDVLKKGLEIEPENQTIQQALQEAEIMNLIFNKQQPMDIDPQSPPTASKTKPSFRKPASPPPAKDPDADLPENKRLAKKEKLLGNDFYKKKQFDEAIQHYQKAIEHDSSDITFYTNIAAVYFEQKEFLKCIAECERGVDIGRENRADFKLIAKALARIGNSYKRLEDWKSAKIYFEKSMSEHRTPEVNALLSEMEKKIREEERTSYIDPVKAEEEKEKGNELFKNGDFQTAIKHYTEAIKRNPDDPKLYSNRAACYTKLAAFDLGLKDCDKCIELDNQFIKGYVRKGKILQGMQQGSKALSAYQKALEIDPTNSEALEGYRACTIGLGSGNHSEEAIQNAMTDPELQAILKDPAMRIILHQMSTDPKAVFEHLKNPEVANKIQKLIGHGIIQIK